MALFNSAASKSQTLQAQLTTTAETLRSSGELQKALAVSLHEQATAASSAAVVAEKQAAAVNQALSILAEAGVTV